jgi:SAM-dependent methyltransferase
MSPTWYKEDLAYIHDVGYNDYALKSTPAILKILAEKQIREGLIVELGCGSGWSALELVKANYQVLGIDLSADLIAIARRRVPQAEFRVESLWKAEIPSCHAVISIGECLNYLFDTESDRPTILQLFHRIYQALVPGGIFIFDLVEPGQVLPETTTKSFNEGQDWIVLVEKEENPESNILTRRIISFRQVGAYYRRDDEIHHLQLYKSTEIAEALNQVGFQVQIQHSYGEYNLRTAHAAFIARKPVVFCTP